MSDAPASQPPSAIEELGAWLVAQGFALVEEAGEMFFGDRRLRWARHDVRVQVSLDRGRWFVDIIPGWWDDWFGFGLEIVVDTLDDADHFTHLLTLKESVAIIENRLPEIAALVSTQDGCNEIEEMGRRRAHRWFGA